MNHAKIFIGLVLTGFIATGCASYETKEASPEKNYANAVASAKISIKKATKMRFEWRDSKKILKAADKAAKAGDYTKAIKLANKAARQGELAVTQAEAQKNAGPI
jgi:hypothetical protein